MADSTGGIITEAAHLSRKLSPVVGQRRVAAPPRPAEDSGAADLKFLDLTAGRHRPRPVPARPRYQHPVLRLQVILLTMGAGMSRTGSAARRAPRTQRRRESARQARPAHRASAPRIAGPPRLPAVGLPACQPGSPGKPRIRPPGLGEREALQ